MTKEAIEKAISAREMSIDLYHAIQSNDFTFDGLNISEDDKKWAMTSYVQDNRPEITTVGQLIKKRKLDRATYKFIRGASLTFADIDARVDGLTGADQDYYENEVAKFESDPNYQGQAEDKGPAIRLKKLSEYTPKPKEWLIPSYIPKGKITLLAGDGGVGKSSLVCNLLTALTSGKKTILEHDIPFGTNRKPLTCVYFNGEDEIDEIKEEKLSGANDDYLLTMDLRDKDFAKIKFGSPDLEDLVNFYKPDLVIFDPLQAFLDPSVQMSSRNQMRQAINPLVGLGQRTGTSFIILMHTNKREKASGRNRLSDSSDLWDIARSVLIAGRVNNDLFYLSHEKSNGCKNGDTILYSISDGNATFQGVTYKKDADFVSETYSKATPSRAEARDSIMSILNEHDGTILVKELERILEARGISTSTMKRAKSELTKEDRIRYVSQGNGKDKKGYIKLCDEKNSDN